MEAKERTEYKTISYKETSYITETSFEEVINIDMSVSQSSVRDYDISSALLNDFHMLQRSDWSWVLILYRIIVRNMLISLITTFRYATLIYGVQTRENYLSHSYTTLNAGYIISRLGRNAYMIHDFSTCASFFVLVL